MRRCDGDDMEEFRECTHPLYIDFIAYSIAADHFVSFVGSRFKQSHSVTQMGPADF